MSASFWEILVDLISCMLETRFWRRLLAAFAFISGLWIALIAIADSAVAVQYAPASFGVFLSGVLLAAVVTSLGRRRDEC